MLIITHYLLNFCLFAIMILIIFALCVWFFFFTKQDTTVMLRRSTTCMKEEKKKHKQEHDGCQTCENMCLTVWLHKHCSLRSHFPLPVHYQDLHGLLRTGFHRRIDSRYFVLRNVLIRTRLIFFDNRLRKVKSGEQLRKTSSPAAMCEPWFQWHGTTFIATWLQTESREEAIITAELYYRL